MDKPESPLPTQLARTTIYESRWVNLHRDRVRLANGHEIEQYHVIEFDTGAVCALVENADGQILMEQMSRYPTSTIAWELPSGGMDPGESAIAAARREVFEETGYETCGHAEVYKFHALTGISNQRAHIVTCQAGRCTGSIDTNEVDAVRWFSFEELMQMIDRREITDSFTLIALLLKLVRK